MANSNNSYFINKSEKLLNILEELRIIKSFNRALNDPDEPKMFRFTFILQPSKKFTDGILGDVNAGGFSFYSKELALLKCLVEAAERFCNVCYKKKALIYSSFQDLKSTALSPEDFGNGNLKRDRYLKNSKKKIFGWTKAKNLITGRDVFIPAQSIYYNYALTKDEILLTEMNSTGAAGGTDKTSAILRGIYEIVERDALMTVYLGKISVPKINPLSINNKDVYKILDISEKYNLEVLIFKLTNDLEIPAYLTMLLDKTGLGPSVSLGLKSSLDEKTAILGSMEEAFHTRPWMKTTLINRKSSYFKSAPDNINNLLQRGLLWLSPKMLSNLGFLINQRSSSLRIKNSLLSPASQLEKIKHIFLKKGFNIYYSDISLPVFKKSGFEFVKIIIPKLQPLFLHEHNKFIDTKLDRIKTVSRYFGKKRFEINPLPHPFL